MDQQTLTLLSQLITGTVALVAGLSGAGITAYINRLNTIDTLTATAAAKDIEYADLREREHDSWLRNQRQEAYAEFLAIAQSVIDAAERDIEGKLGEHKLDDIPVLLARLRLVGTATPIQRAESIEFTARLVVTLRKQMDTASDKTVYNRTDSWMEMTRLVSVFRIDVREYVKAVREDLETGPAELDNSLP